VSEEEWEEWVAVGTDIADRPPRGSVRALLTHKMFSTTFYAQCGEVKDVAKSF
jgi:hypothetical protein